MFIMSTVVCGVTLGMMTDHATTTGSASAAEQTVPTAEQKLRGQLTFVTEHFVQHKDKYEGHIEFTCLKFSGR